VHRPTDVPRWVYIPAAVGTAFVVLPLLAIAIKVDWPNFWSLITSSSSKTALLLSLKTAAASTALCVLFGVPMALVLARSRARPVRLLRPLILLPLVLPPVVGGIALLYAFGRVGLLGRYLEAAGLRVIATRRSADAPATDTDGADLVLPADRILQVAAESDFLAVCAQLTPETRGLVDGKVFAAMKPGAVLINIARGEEVDEDALIAAVTTGRIRGAVLDVYDGELAGRPPRAELLDLPQILLTPHISARGDAGLAGPIRRLFAENLRRFLDDRPLLNVVDRDRGY